MGKLIFIPPTPLAPGIRYRFVLSADLAGTVGTWEVAYSTLGIPALRAETVPPGAADDDTTAATLHTLADGWNLVGWNSDGAVAAAVAAIADRVISVYTFDAARQTFRFYDPSGPLFLNTLTELRAGDGVWIRVRGRTTWPRPEAAGERRLSLSAGFNLVDWAGPDGTAVSDAVAGLGDALDTLFLWDRQRQRFLSYKPGGLAILNSATVLQRGDGIWLSLTRAAEWLQPAP